MRIILAAFLFSLGLSGCSKVPELNPLPEDGIILAFGDSLTYGTGVKKDNSYPSHLARLINRKVINAGIPGELSAKGLKRLPGLLDKHQPDLMILIHGGNDMLKKRDLDKAADNLRAMVREAQQRDIDVAMMAVPNPTLILSPAEFYEVVAEDMGVPIEIDAISDILQYPSNKSDAVHPNAKGYQAMAEELLALLQAANAL